MSTSLTTHGFHTISILANVLSHRTYDLGRVLRFWGEREDAPKRLYRHHRPKFHKMLLAQLEKVGLQVEYSQRVISYFEDIDLGVIFDRGRRLKPIWWWPLME